MTDTQTKTADKFTLFRHVRNGDIAKAGNKRVSNLGGVTLYLEVDQTSATFQFAFAVAGTGDNFNKKIAKDISVGRFNKGQVIAGHYNRNVSLVDNCVAALTEAVEHKLYTFVKESQVKAALSRLREFSTNLPRAPFTGARAKGSGTVVPAAPAAWNFPKSAEQVAFAPSPRAG